MSITFFEVYKAQLVNLLAKGSNIFYIYFRINLNKTFKLGRHPDFLRYRNYIFKLLKGLEDPKTSLIIMNKRSVDILEELYRWAKAVADSNI